MSKIQAFAKEHTITYCVMVEILVLAALTGIGMLLGMVFSAGDYYALLGAQEAIGAVLAEGFWRACIFWLSVCIQFGYTCLPMRESARCARGI